MAKHTSRNQPLDILRGIAILLVLGYHANYINAWTTVGWSGVDLFFVLSGFLISGLLFSEYARMGSIDVKRFLIRRGFKIYPPFYALMVYTAINYIVSRGLIPTKIFGDIFFVQNYFPHIWPQGWSLAVEEHFYWTLPFLLIFLIRRSRDRKNPFRAIPWVFLSLGVICLSLRAIEVWDGVPPNAVQFPTHLRIDSLFAGVALGYCKAFHPDLFHKLTTKLLWIPGLLLLVPAFIFPLGTMFTVTIGFTGLYLGYGCIVAWAFKKPSSANPAARLLAWIGYYSYSIYLWHPVCLLIFNIHRGLVFFLLYLIAAVVLGAGMSWLIEIPSLELREKLYPARRPSSSQKLVLEPTSMPQPVATE